jgi:hypothetical protein
MNKLGPCSIAAIAAMASTMAFAEMPKQMPKDGVLSPGEVVLVDDGRCPAGEVKQVTGGNKAKNIPREVKCVPKPQ